MLAWQVLPRVCPDRHPVAAFPSIYWLEWQHSENLCGVCEAINVASATALLSHLHPPPYPPHPQSPPDFAELGISLEEHALLYLSL